MESQNIRIIEPSEKMIEIKQLDINNEMNFSEEQEKSAA